MVRLVHPGGTDPPPSGRPRCRTRSPVEDEHCGSWVGILLRARAPSVEPSQIVDPERTWLWKTSADRRLVERRPRCQINGEFVGRIERLDRFLLEDPYLGKRDERAFIVTSAECANR